MSNGGKMFRFERDEHGRLRAVPDEQTYMERVGGGEPYLVSNGDNPRPRNATDPTPNQGAWRIWKLTDAEPGEAPDYDEMTPGERAEWFGPDALDDEANGYGMRFAWFRLCSWIAAMFPGCHALRSPGMTGCVLIEHTLPWARDERLPYRYLTLPDGLSRLVAATAPPWRMEATGRPGAQMSQYTVYDARISYGAHLRMVAPITGPGIVHDHESTYERYRPGRYLVDVTVRPAWDRIGLARRPAGPQEWDYPAKPGESWEVWLDEVEVRLLADNAWPFAVRERILYDPKGERGKNPLGVFCDRLDAAVAAIERGDPQWVRGARGENAPQARAIRHALRSLMIQPVGLWHRGKRASWRPIQSTDELQPGEVSEAVRGELLAVTREPLTGPVARWRRPEWAATVYAYQHVAAVKRALSVPRESLLAIVGDAIHLADYDPCWFDDGRIGAYRRKVSYQLPAPRPVPTTLADIRALDREVARAQKAK